MTTEIENKNYWRPCDCAGVFHKQGCPETRVIDAERERLTSPPAATHTPTPWEIKVLDPATIAASARPYRDLAATYGDDAEASANAAHIVRCVNAHQALVDALKLFVAMDKCNYELETMRRSGLFEQVDAALALAEGRSDES